MATGLGRGEEEIKKGKKEGTERRTPYIFSLYFRFVFF